MMKGVELMTPLVFTLIFNIFGLLIIINGIRLYHKDISLIKDHQTTEGVVTDIRVTSGSDDSGIMIPIITCDEIGVTFESKIQKGIFDRYSIGDKVDIIYTRIDDEYYCEIRNIKMIYVNVYLWLIIGSFTLLGTNIAYFFGLFD